jgi:hypothetical protein
MQRHRGAPLGFWGHGELWLELHQPLPPTTIFCPLMQRFSVGFFDWRHIRWSSSLHFYIWCQKPKVLWPRRWIQSLLRNYLQLAQDPLLQAGPSSILGSALHTGRFFPMSLLSDEELERGPGEWRRINVSYECDWMMYSMYGMLLNMKNKQKEWHPATKPFATT